MNFDGCDRKSVANCSGECCSVFRPVAGGGSKSDES